MERVRERERRKSMTLTSDVQRASQERENSRAIGSRFCARSNLALKRHAAALSSIPSAR